MTRPDLFRAVDRIGVIGILGLAIARGSGALWPAAIDLHAYYAAGTVDPYANSVVGARDAYLYAPAFTQAFALLRLLPFPILVGLWTAGMLLLLRWLAPRAWPLLAVIFVQEIIFGNVELLLAAVAVIGFRHPAAWSFALLTKVTPGVGLLWFAVRREWRPLLLCAGATAGVVLLSAALAPGLWTEWLASLLRNARSAPDAAAMVSVPLFLRLPAAAALVAWGARTDRRWTVPVAVVLATPVLWTVSAFVILAAILPLRRTRLEEAPCAAVPIIRHIPNPLRLSVA